MMIYLKGKESKFANVTAVWAVQMKVLSRITLRPLVDTLPCMGAVTISLVETPYIDFALHLFKKFDLMLLPGVSQIANYFIQLVSCLCLPTNCITENLIESESLQSLRAICRVLEGKNCTLVML